MKKVLRVISLILFNVMVIVFIFAALFNYLVQDPEIENLLSEYVPFFDSGVKGSISSSVSEATYPTWYSSVEDVLDGNGAVAAAAEAEGAVLLKNDNNALPLNSDTDKIDVFGIVAYAPMYSLGGAGSVTVNSAGEDRAAIGISSNYNGTGSTTNRRQYLHSELSALGFNVNMTLANTYNNTILTQSKWNSSDYYENSNGNVNKIRCESWSDVSSSYSGYNTAIFVIGRMTTEDTDLPPHNTNNNRFGSGDYLTLTSEEESMLSNLATQRSNGTFDKLILIFNQANPMQQDLSSLYETYKIDAAVWMGYPGSDGIRGLASLLSGKSSFSGNLSDMWYAGHSYNPSDKNWGLSNVTLQEDMYLGYRYAETRYEDMILGTANAGNYSYSTAVNYPFGYGYTYSDGSNYNSGFSMTVDSIEGNDDPDKNYYTTGTYTDEDGVVSKRYAYEKYSTGATSYVLDHENSQLKPEEEWRASGDSLGDYDDLTMEVTVTNTGSVAGKKVVQIYLQQAPYKGNGTVEKVAVELVGYAKTSKLGPGESETLTINIDANKYFASYDNSLTDEQGNTVGGYELDAGTYYLTAASNSHEAINNILKYKIANGTSAPNSSSMDTTFGAGSEALVKAVEVDADRAASYEYWTQGGTTPANQMNESDPNYRSSNVTFMTRSNWSASADNAQAYNLSSGTVGTSYTNTAFGSSVALNNNAATQLYYPNAVDATKAFDYGTKTVASGETYDIVLSDMIGVEYDTRRGATDEDVAKWDEFLGQLTWSDYVQIFSTGKRQTASLASVGKPGTNDINASNGFQFKFSMSDMATDDGTPGLGFSTKYDSENSEQWPTGYPCEGIIASSFNIEVAYACGQALGEDGLWAGASGIYGFGLGLHRNPYHGRAGEYYSDDPYLTGTIGGYESLGAQSKGLYVYNKHFICDDQEYCRTSYNVWGREQTFREIYLRPFEIAIEISDAMNVMTSFNNVGGIWSGAHYGLITTILRGEFGMAGFAVSDWKQSYMNLTWGLLAGNDLLDGTVTLNSDYQNTGYFQTAMKTSAERILYTVANSNALNGMSAGSVSHPYSFDPAWISYKDTVINAINIVFAFSAVFVVVTTAWTACSYLYSKVKKNKSK